MSDRKIVYPGQKGSKHSLRKKSTLKKKHHPPNRHELEKEEQSTSNAAKRFKTSNIDVEVDATFGYRIINFVSVFSAISEVVKCKTCDGEVTFAESSMRGLGFKILVKCDNCTDTGILSCPLIEGKAYDVNRRIAFVFRLLGLGYDALQKFCSLMDLPKTFTKSIFDSVSKNVFCAAEAVAEKSLKKAAHEERMRSQSFGEDVFSVSGDRIRKSIGSIWSGVWSLIGRRSGKVVDFATRVSSCGECEKWEDLFGSPEYFTWYQGHRDNCENELRDEDEVFQEMFDRSEEKYDVKCANFVGKNDHGNLKRQVDSKDHKDTMVKKRNSVDKLQTIMGLRLREALKTKASLDKDTKALINKLSVRYGLTVEKHSDKNDLKNATWGNFTHEISTDKEPQHEFCDVSWCSYLKAKQADSLNDYVHPDPLPEILQNVIKPIYVQLTSENWLNLCEGTFRRRNGERLKSAISRMLPETKTDQEKDAYFAAAVTTCEFNDGFESILMMMQLKSLTIGQNCYSLHLALDDKSLREKEQTQNLLERNRKLMLAGEMDKQY